MITNGKKTVAAMAIIFMSVAAMASQVKKFDTQYLEEFNYTRGYKAGAKDGYALGYKQAIEFAERQLRLYKTKIEAYENGKYLKNYEGIITAPAVYQKVTKNGVQIIVEGCKISKPLTPDEILTSPIYPIDATRVRHFDARGAGTATLASFPNMGSGSTPLYQPNNSSGANSFNVLNSSGGNGYFSQRPSSHISKLSYYYLPNTKRVRQELDSGNYTYTISQGRVKIIFQSKAEKNKFLEMLSTAKN